MKTVGQALIDEIHYPLSAGFVENKLIARGLYFEDEYLQETAQSKSFKGAVADCLYSLIEAPSFSEGDKSINLSDKSIILKKANALYKAIGEEEKSIDSPKVCIIN